MPPIMWFFILWYSGLFDASDTIRLIHSPLMLTFLFLCNVCVFLVLHQKLKKIQRYLDDPSEQNLFPAQRSIYQLPLIFIILEAVYCLGGANVPLIGKEFIDSREYLLAWLFGVPIMTAYSLPFFILSTHNLEKWAHSVPVSERKAFLGFKTRFYIIISVASVGIIAMIFIFNDALLAKYSGIQLNIIRQKQIILGIISLISIMVAVIPFISLVSKQIGEMRKFVLLAGDGDFRGRIKIEERDELSALANTFNQMADRATERKAEIISATNRLNAIIDSATGFYISTTDMKGDITSWNKGAEQIMGYTEDEVIGKMNFSEIIYDEGEVLADLKKIIKGLSEGKTYERELNMERKDGLVFPALVSSSPLKDEMENQIGILVVFQDITKLKQAEESLRRAKEKAEKTNLKLKESIERTKTMAVAAQAA
ncbi:MAG: PAS domain S-box protein, partial [Thermodesulfobacteriota bacterium]|nr:PAS domain S-box protein [Thermodesulfobacteriota bacterium]